jgi:hypothetical protein
LEDVLAQQEAVSIAQAAKLLGLTEDGIRKRVRKGELRGEKIDNKWHVYVEIGKNEQEPVLEGAKTATREQQDSIESFLAHLQAEIEFLRAQIQEKDQDIQAWQEQARYKDLVIAQLQDRMIQLPAAEEAEPTEQGSEIPEPAAAQAADGGNALSRFWRWFVGGG